ncbi:MAG TPA: nitrogen regulation protein NR(II) [Burkholderiaceae bacterium]|nr:nitrogen regulation protein NR(II) [Burkholderiaceae bacterium]
MNLHRRRLGLPSASADDSGLDLLSVAVLLIDREGIVRRANAAAETTFDLSRRLLEGHAARGLFVQSTQIDELLAGAVAHAYVQRRRLLAVRRSLREPLPASVVASSTQDSQIALVLELSDVRQAWRGVSREERRTDVSEANRRLLRNLAHEIKNPLGGIRGAAQLLETELRGGEQLEYTRVIIAEADRLQSLLDRVLAPNRGPRVIDVLNIHEVCERVRALIQAEFPGLRMVRDYDASVPHLRGDREQLIQALLNVVRNAAQALTEQAMQDGARIEIRTRIARQVTFARRHCRLALDLRVLDNGPGVPEEIRERVFDPLVSGREGGSGLGLALAQSYIQENGGMIHFESEPGRTEFRILLPLDADGEKVA